MLRSFRPPPSWTRNAELVGLTEGNDRLLVIYQPKHQGTIVVSGCGPTAQKGGVKSSPGELTSRWSHSELIAHLKEKGLIFGVMETQVMGSKMILSAL
jgi:hypothetical protein